jgi:hypothetical protein
VTVFCSGEFRSPAGVQIGEIVVFDESVPEMRQSGLLGFLLEGSSNVMFRNLRMGELAK